MNNQTKCFKHKNKKCSLYSRQKFMKKKRTRAIPNYVLGKNFEFND